MELGKTVQSIALILEIIVRGREREKERERGREREGERERERGNYSTLRRILHV